MIADFSSRVLQQLQDKQLITPDQGVQLLQQATGLNVSVLQLIEEQRLIRTEEIAKAKSEVLNMEYIDLSGVEVKADVLKVIAEETAQNYLLAPFHREDDIVSVAFVNPEDIRANEALDFIARQERVHFKNYVASPMSVKHILRQYGNLHEEVEEALATADVTDIELGDKEIIEDEVVKTAPVSKMISVILKHAIEGVSSDVHIEPMGDETRVRYRVDGVLHTSLVIPGKVHQALVSRIKVLANLKLDETRLPQDGRFKMKFEGRDVEFRVSTLPLIENEKVVMRILDTSSSVLSLEDLGFHDYNLTRASRNLQQPHGMLLITGPTGSGKSTTLYSMLSLLNKEGINIITLEDPVEYDLPGIAQSQMKPEIGLTFSAGLRSVLRQDPDVIMVGEIRDQETADLAVHAALTGHMMLSTLHTNNAVGAIPRLIDMGIEPFLLASSLNVVVGQRLIRKICEHCKEMVELNSSQIKDIEAEIQAMPAKFLPHDVSLLPPYTVYKGMGCSRCDDGGYHGRISINEVLENTKALKKIIDDGDIGKTDIVLKEMHDQGMFTLRQDGLIKVFRGQTTFEEVWNATKE
ncbi:MAG: GspE/PulE family protein [bacterium]|nr:GspE/PulE family protein [bacterium]